MTTEITPDTLYVRANLRYDPIELRSWLYEKVVGLQQVYQGTGGYFGGWSVQSGTGDYRDGWAAGRQALTGSTGTGKVAINWDKFNEIFPVQPKDMRTPTQIYNGPVIGIIDQIEKRCQGYPVLPSRTRVTKLDAGSQLGFHRDSPDENWRIHIPIITNDGCWFEWDTDGDGQPDVRLQMPIGSAWFVRVDKLHRFVNHGDEDRMHLLVTMVYWKHQYITGFNEKELE